MPPTLDLGSQSTHAKMLVSPRLNLRRGLSYQTQLQLEKGPLSSTSSRFNFNHLIFSPPPSPSLPALVPRPRKNQTTPRPSRVFRLLVFVAGIFSFLYLASAILSQGYVAVVDWALEATRNRNEYEMVGQYDLPDFPTPIAITDHNGRSKWTISIPKKHSFPLSATEYSDITAKCHEVATHVRESRAFLFSPQQPKLDYYFKDPNFIDIGEAEKQGLLPSPEAQPSKLEGRGVAAQQPRKRLLGERSGTLIARQTCQSSLTFVLEPSDVGLGTSMMMMWMAYGLAQKEQRAFFIDDSKWAYGDYVSIFKAPPAADCKPPPRHQMVPCPHNAQHLVVSSSTARETFGKGFNNEFEDPQTEEAHRERPTFDLARVGFEALFHLNDDDHKYINQRVQDLKAKSSAGAGKDAAGTIVGVHVRHGDVHPYEYQYHGAYVPLNVYTEKARELLGHTATGDADTAAKQHSFMVLASDDPDVYESDEFSKALRAQEQIKLARKQEVKKAKPDPTHMHNFVDEAFGWEGGFFTSMFWNLGSPQVNNANIDSQKTLGRTPDAVRLRSLVGRAYLMDLAVLAQASDSVICTISATGCRLMAVMMGWEKAIDQEHWVNVDGSFSWSGLA